MYDLKRDQILNHIKKRGVVLTLADMKENDSGIILYINNECEIKRRLYDMGFIKEMKSVVCAEIFLARL